MRIRLGQDYKTEDSKTFAVSILKKWSTLVPGAVVLEASTMLMDIYNTLSNFTQSRQDAPKPSLENAALIISYLNAAASIANALKQIAPPETLSAANSSAYKKIVAVMNRIDAWYTPADGALKIYLNDCEMGDVSTFSDQVAMEAIKIGNLESAHVTLAVKDWAIAAAYNSANPNYSKFSAIREKYNSDGTPKPGTVAVPQTPESKKEQIVSDFKTFQVDIAAGKTPEIAKKLATQTGAPAAATKIILITAAAAIGAYLMFKG